MDRDAEPKADAKVNHETGSRPVEEHMAVSSDASAIIVQKIESDKTDSFLVWQKGIASAAAAFPGYERTEVFPPIENVGQDEWVTILHFASHDDLENWLASDVRKGFNKRFNEEFGRFHLRKMSAGLGILFPMGKTPVTPWKSVMVVVLGLYPSVTIFGALTKVPLAAFPAAYKTLLANIVCTICLQFFVVQILQKMFEWWIRPAKETTGLNLRGAIIIATLLAAMAFTSKMLLG